MPNPSPTHDSEQEKIRRLIAGQETETALRMIIAFARSSKSPKHIFTELIEELYAHYLKPEDVEGATDEARADEVKFARLTVTTGDMDVDEFIGYCDNRLAQLSTLNREEEEDGKN